MNTTEIIAIVSGLLVGGSLAYAYICLRKYEALIALMGAGTEVCFLCRKPRLGHDILEDDKQRQRDANWVHMTGGEDHRQHLDPVHDYMPALLLYFPDPDLR